MYDAKKIFVPVQRAWESLPKASDFNHGWTPASAKATARQGDKHGFLNNLFFPKMPLVALIYLDRLILTTKTSRKKRLRATFQAQNWVRFKTKPNAFFIFLIDL
jgi:hypothetical protein